MKILTDEQKKELLESIAALGESIPFMDMDDRDFVAALLYRMAKIVREHGPSHGVNIIGSETLVNYKGVCVDEFEFRETPGGVRLIKWADSADRLPECKLEDLISKVIYNPPATVIYWKDGTKTVVRCSDQDFDAGRMDPETGILYAIVKKVLGNKGNFNDVLRRLVKRAKKN